MPDIIIKGMEMPRVGSVIAICANGDVIDAQDNIIGRAIELSPHGDLVDRSELQNTVMQVITKFPTDNIAAIQHLDLVNALLRGATVIVPAEKGETQ